MKLILHVGMAKTGTSTLQSSLNAHPNELGRAGFLYPVPKFRKSNHNFLAVLCQEEARYHREFLQHDATPAMARSRAEEFWADLKKQIGRAGQETVILSGEYFFGMNLEEVSALGELLRGVFEDISVVVYVREPAAYYLSLTQQRVKGSAELSPPKRFNVRARRLIPRLEERLGAVVTARPFDRELLVGGDVVVDFLTVVLGMSEMDVSRFDVNVQNASMSAEAMCVMQLVRRHVFADRDGQFTPGSRAIMQRFEELRAEIPQSAPELRPKIAAALRRSHQADLEYLAERFDIRFPSAQPLDPSDPDPVGWESGELTQLLNIDRESVNRAMAQLLADFAGRSARRRR